MRTTDGLESKVKEAKKIPGLHSVLENATHNCPWDYGTSGMAYLAALEILPKENTAAYIVNCQEWYDSRGSRGIEYSVKVGAFRNGKTATSEKIIYVTGDYYRIGDDYSKAYDKIKNITVEEEKVKIRVASNEAERDFEFNI